MSNPMGDRNLLAGILAYDKKFISGEALVAAMNAWTQAKEKGLAQILREQKALTENQHALLEEAVYAQLAKHGNDATNSLAAINSDEAIKQELAKIPDSDLQASVAHVATAKPDGPLVLAEVIEIEAAPKKEPAAVKAVKVAPKASAAPASTMPARKSASGFTRLALLAGGAIVGGFLALVALMAVGLAVFVFLRGEKPIAQVKSDDTPITRGREEPKGNAMPPIKDADKGPKQAEPPIDPAPPIDPGPLVQFAPPPAPDNVVVAPPVGAPPFRADPGFVSLFNGKDLTGWKERFAGGWRVQNGVLIGSAAANRNAILHTDAKFKDFHLRAEVRSGTKTLAKLGFRSADSAPLGYDASINSLPAGDVRVGIINANTGKKGFTLPRLGPEQKIPPGQWFNLEVIAQGDRFIVLVNGKKTTDAADASIPDAGFVRLFQAGAEPIEFRKIEIKELAAVAVAPPPPRDPVVVADFVPLFNGKDLTGWKTHPQQPGNWRVKDGILTGAGAAHDTLYTTRADFKDYHLRMEVRVNDGGRGSIYCRSPFGPELKPLLPIGFQTEICNTPKELNRTGGVNIRYKGGVTGRNFQSFLQPGEWFTLEIRAEGNRVSSRLNTKAAESMVDQDRVFMSGAIGIYLGRAGTVLDFRTIEIRELAPVALAPLPPKEMPGKDAAPFLAAEGFVPLFNGMDLTAWNINGRQKWRVVDGVLTGSDAQGGGHRMIATARDDYGDFHLRMEARLNHDGNASVLFRYPHALAEVENTRVAGYELRLTNVAAYAAQTGTLYVYDKTGTRSLLFRERRVPPGTWFNLEVIAKGNQVDILINGQKVNSFLNPNTHLMGGRIVLGYMNNLNRQTAMEYRKIEIKEFKRVKAPPQPPPPRPLAGFAPIFNGKDLTGWRVEGKESWQVNDAGELVGQGPDTAILTMRADYRNLIAKIELIASPDVEAYFGFRESQAPTEKVIGLTTRLTGDKGVVQAGRVGTDGTKAEVGNPRIHVRGGEKFLLEVHVTRDQTHISVNGTLSTAMGYPIDAHPPGAIGLHIVKGTVRIKKFAVSAEPPGGLVEAKAAPKEAPPKEKPPANVAVVPLFNGKDLTGWQPHAKRPGNWRVENGILIGSAPNGGSLYSTRGDYQDFHLRAEVRINDKGFGRIFARAAYDPTKIPAKVLGYEVLINQRPLGDKTGTLTATSPTYTSLTQAKETPAAVGDWLLVEVIAKGDLVTVKLNTQSVAEFRDERRQIARSGVIGLHQDANATIEFRKVEIEDLSAR